MWWLVKDKKEKKKQKEGIMDLDDLPALERRVGPAGLSEKVGMTSTLSALPASSQRPAPHSRSEGEQGKRTKGERGRVYATLSGSAPRTNGGGSGSSSSDSADESCGDGGGASRLVTDMAGLPKFLYLMTLGYSFYFNLKNDLIGDIDNPNGFSNLFVPDVEKPFDFIVVGGGTAGSVIASRLTEDPQVRVLLVEAGSDGTLFSDIPTGLAFLAGNRLYDWMHPSQRENTSCSGFNDGVCTLSRGKMLGGSSAMNAMLYVRGNRKDFDLWQLEGNSGWSFEDLLPYFRKSEDNRIATIQNDRKYHGTGGPLPVSQPSFRTVLSGTWLEAGQQIGYPLVDYNGPVQTGFALPQLTTGDGQRFSAARAYLRPHNRRPNLQVILNSRVTKILVDGNGAAQGVQFIRHGFLYAARAKREVVLCAGAISSPQVLKLSGIGPALELQSFGLPVVQNLPVGLNMESHVAVGGLVFSVRKPVTLLLKNIATNLTGFVDYALNGEGPLGAVPVEGVGFVNSRLNADRTWPDLQLELETYNPLTGDGGYLFPRFVNLKREIADTYSPLFNKHSVQVVPFVLRPKSRGQILLRSRNPLDHPIVIRNWYQHPDDVRLALEGVKTVMEVMTAKPFLDAGVEFFPAVLPPCAHLPHFSDRYWECHIRTFSWTQWHETSTCKMGPPGDPLAVVDNKLRVYGVRKLRVADTSVFPHITSGNLQAPTYMVAEKAADLIREDWL